MFKKKLTLKILLFLVFADILETVTQLCFKKSALVKSGFEINKFLDAAIFLKAVFSSPFLWLGFFSVFLLFIIWATILSKIDLSVAVPIASFSYLFVPLVSIAFLREKITVLRWAGIVFILLGVIFVSLSSKEKEGPLA